MNAFYFGVTRFSVFSPGSLAWVLSKNEKEEKSYLDNLYSDDRMNPRVEIFLKKALPSYELMGKSYHYKHIIQYSNELPEKYKSQLMEVEKKYPFVVLQNVSDVESVHEVIKSLMIDTGADDSVVVMFRVDDDDILSFDYLYQLSQYALNEYVGKAVSFGAGLTAIYSNGRFECFKQFRQLLMSQGQAYIGKYSKARSQVYFPRTGNHTRIDELTPVIVDSRSVAFLQTHHELQDTRVSEEKTKAKDRILSKLLNYDDIEDYVHASEKFPMLREEILMQEIGGEALIDFEMQSFENTVHFDVSLLSSRQYRVQYEVEGGTPDYNSRGLLLGFLVSDDSVLEIPGLVKSSNKDIGFYKYIPTEAGVSSGAFKFWVPEGVDIADVYLQPWKCVKGQTNIRNLSLSM